MKRKLGLKKKQQQETPVKGIILNNKGSFKNLVDFFYAKSIARNKI